MLKDYLLFWRWPGIWRMRSLSQDVKITCKLCRRIIKPSPAWGVFFVRDGKPIKRGNYALFRWKGINTYYKFSRNCFCGGELMLFIDLYPSTQNIKFEFMKHKGNE